MLARLHAGLSRRADVDPRLQPGVRADPGGASVRRGRQRVRRAVGGSVGVAADAADPVAGRGGADRRLHAARDALDAHGGARHRPRPDGAGEGPPGARRDASPRRAADVSLDRGAGLGPLAADHHEPRARRVGVLGAGLLLQHEARAGEGGPAGDRRADAPGAGDLGRGPDRRCSASRRTSWSSGSIRGSVRAGSRLGRPCPPAPRCTAAIAPAPSTTWSARSTSCARCATPSSRARSITPTCSWARAGPARPRWRRSSPPCLNCVKGPTITPCGVCESCVSIANATSLDVIEMDAASNNSVDDIRDLRERVAYAPVSGRHKVYILDEAHMLSTAGVERVPQDARGAAAEHDLRAGDDRGQQGPADGRRPLPSLRLRAPDGRGDRRRRPARRRDRRGSRSAPRPSACSPATRPARSATRSARSSSSSPTAARRSRRTTCSRCSASPTRTSCSARSTRSRRATAKALLAVARLADRPRHGALRARPRDPRARAARRPDARRGARPRSR